VTDPTAWDREHFPVLKSAVDGLNADRTMAGFPLRDIATEVGLEPIDVVAALKALENGGLLEVHWTMPPWGARVTRASEAGQTLAGAWPTEDNFADRLIAALEQVAANTDDEDTRTRTQKIVDLLSGAGRDIAVGVGTAMITGAIQ